MPMNIFLAPTLNQDAVLIPLSMFFIASILYLAKTPEATLTLKWLAALWAISLLLTLGKPVYLLLTILFLLIPKSKMKNRFFYYGFLVLMIFTGISVTVLWNWLVKDLTVNFQPWSSPVDQLNVILKNPLNYLIVNLRTYWTFKGLYLFSHIGQLGWLDVVLPPKVIFTYLGAIFFAEIVNNGMNIKASEKLLFFGIFIASILLTSFALYLIWSPVGDPYIHGIQGRYFIPFVPLFWMIFHNNFKVRTSAVPFLKIIVFLYLMIIFYTVTNRLLDRYYLSP
jgi:uncharacterized membrane protein